MYVIMQNNVVWEYPYDDVKEAQKVIEEVIERGDTDSIFMIYKLVLATEPRVKVEWT